MRTRVAAALITVGVMLCAAAVSTAQEQTGRAEGTVRDQQSGVLTGATVQARNLTVGSVLEVVTDAGGTFRFAALGPGNYDITATLEGFRPSRFERVEILLGQI